MVKIKGYGVVTPDREDIALEKPELIRHGNKFGVKIKASSPSIHMIRANIETEIAPIVGTEQQAQDLIHLSIRRRRSTVSGRLISSARLWNSWWMTASPRKLLPSEKRAS